MSALWALQGGVETVGSIAVFAGTILVALGVVALGVFVYRSAFGDGVRWPDEEYANEEEGVRRGTDDEEWRYY
ncbi:MAG: hypothetical protein ABEJ73_04035 [Haloplanus sp.]